MMFMQEKSKMENLTVKVFGNIIMKVRQKADMSVNLKKEIVTDKELLHGQVDLNMLVDGKITLGMERQLRYLQMEL